MVKTKTMIAQLILRAVIFLLLLLGIFIVVPGLRYIFMLFIIANIVLGFINNKKDIPANIIFVILTPLLFVPVLEYLITIILEVLLGIHLVMFYLWFRKDGVVEVKKNNKKGKDKKDEDKGRKFPVWLIVLLTVVAVVVLLVALLIIVAFAGFTSGGVQVAG